MNTLLIVNACCKIDRNCLLECSALIILSFPDPGWYM